MNKESPIPGVKLVGREELMEFLGIKPVLLWKLQNHPNPKKRLPTYKIGKTVRYRVDKVLAWLEDQRQSLSS